MLDCVAGSTALKQEIATNEKLQIFEKTTGILLMGVLLK